MFIFLLLLEGELFWLSFYPVPKLCHGKHYLLDTDYMKFIRHSLSNSYGNDRAICANIYDLFSVVFWGQSELEVVTIKAQNMLILIGVWHFPSNRKTGKVTKIIFETCVRRWCHFKDCQQGYEWLLVNQKREYMLQLKIKPLQQPPLFICFRELNEHIPRARSSLCFV